MSVAEKIKQEIIQPQKNNNGLLVGNPVYKPFRYPWCYDAWLTQQRIHWLPEEVPLGDDVREIGRAHVRTPVTEKSRMPSSA